MHSRITLQTVLCVYSIQVGIMLYHDLDNIEVETFNTQLCKIMLHACRINNMRDEVDYRDAPATI